MRMTRTGRRAPLGYAGMVAVLALAVPCVTASHGRDADCPATTEVPATAGPELQKSLEQLQSAAQRAVEASKAHTGGARAPQAPTCACECGTDVMAPHARTRLLELDDREWRRCVACLQTWTEREAKAWKSARPAESDKAARGKFDDQARETARAISDAYHALKHRRCTSCRPGGESERTPCEPTEAPCECGEAPYGCGEAPYECGEAPCECKKTRESMNRQRKDLHESVRRLLSDVGLWQPISAELVTGFLTGAVSGKNEPASGGGTLPQGYLQFASHRAALSESSVGDMRLDVNLTGRFGFVPALCLLPPVTPTSATPDASAPAADSKPAARLQQAFIWETGAMMNLRASLYELSLVATAGQVNADDRSSIQGTGEDAVLLVPLSGNGDFRWHWAGGVRTRIYTANQTPTYVQELNGLVEPALEATVLYKREPRFSERRGVIVPEAGWPQRLTLRLMLNSIPVIDSGAAPGSPPKFTISLGVEYEGRWPWNHDRQNVPAVTRLLIYGKLDLLRTLKGG